MDLARGAGPSVRNSSVMGHRKGRTIKISHKSGLNLWVGQLCIGKKFMKDRHGYISGDFLSYLDFL